MITRTLSVALFVGLFVALTAGSAFAQSSFSDSNVEYTFDLADPTWKMTARPSATSPNVEYVYGDRQNGHLRIRKLTVGKNDTMTEIIQNEEQKLQFLVGFVAGKQETFSGRLSGSIYNYEYVSAGRSMAGRLYFLRANDTTVYMLMFNGQKDSLRSIRNQTDQIARTFAVK